MKLYLKNIGYIIFHRLFFRVKEYNKESLENKSFILCPNHTSDYDGPIFWSSMDNISIMAKKECFKNKIVGNFLTKINVVSVDRDSKQGNEVRQAIKYLKEGKKDKKVYMLFPQGTISDINKNTINRIKPGAFYIANLSKLPIVPVFIEQPRPFRRVRIVYGNKIEIDIRNENGVVDKEKLTEFRELWRKEILRLQQEAEVLEKRPVRKLKLSLKHANNNNG
jgi:1-acyl-sn-glycerol-3-phosphate acyltransferase